MARVPLAEMFGWSPRDEHRHRVVICGNEWVMRAADGIRCSIAYQVSAGFMNPMVV